MPTTPADWQLPPGVDRALWHYLHDPDLAQSYDAALAGTPLLALDLEFVRRHCAPPGRLVDLGCGTGRALVPLAREGHWVLGIDLSPEMLRVAGARAAAAGVAVERVRANLVELGGLADAAFDYAICLFSTLGMVAGADNRLRVLRHAHRLIRPGGKLVLHVHNRWFNFWDPQGRAWLVRDGLRALWARTEAGNKVMPAHQGQLGLTLHVFTRREVLRLVRAAGFEVLEVRRLSLRPDGRLPAPWWFGWLRTYGFFLAARLGPS
jgi:SAM-dependent methyltransferase